MVRRSQRMANRRNPNSRGGTEPSNADVNENQVDPNLLAAVNQVVADHLPNIVAQAIQAALQQANIGPTTNVEGGEQPDPRASNPVGRTASTGDIHIWLERFQKQKPQSFSSAPTPVDAENWIAHIQKIFEVLGCPDVHKVKLGAYKLEGDAQRWWHAIRQAKGDDYINNLSWMRFREAFYQQFFSAADKNAYVREYATIRQRDDESVSDYLARFLRLAGFAGTLAGTSIEQAEKFKWTINYEYRSKLINENFTDVAQAANAAKNIEMERLDYEVSTQESSKRRNRDSQPIQQEERKTQQQKNDREYQWNRNNNTRQGAWNGQGQRQSQGHNRNNYHGQVRTGNPNNIPVMPCNQCGSYHPGKPCYRASGACFSCGQRGHKAKDCAMQTRNNNDNDGGDKQRNANASGRVFALRGNQNNNA